MALLAALCGCGGGGGSAIDAAPESPSAPALSLGLAQKGPYLAGSIVTLYRLVDDGSRGAQTAVVHTGDLGWFVPAAPWGGLTELEVGGRFFDETTGASSAGPVRLAAVVELPAADRVCINLFTHLAAARIRARMSAGDSYPAARDAAGAELRALFQLSDAAEDALPALDLTDGGSAQAADNANLLLFSAAVLAAGLTQDGLDGLAADFADDGRMNGAAYADWLRVTVHAGSIDVDRVAARIESLQNLTRAPGFDALGNRYPAWVNLAGDADADGVTDADEILRHATDPLRADSDGDSMPDGWELASGLDPLLDDAAADPDGDGLANLDERARLTDPLRADSDGDAMPDGWELANGLDPLRDDAGADPDNDALANLEELLRLTDPQLADSDGDGMTDGWEVAALLDPRVHDGAQDPDADGLVNAEEFARGTDPHSPDSDGDGWQDGFEVSGGGDPADAASVPLVFLSSPVTSAETGFAYAYSARASWPQAVFSLDEAPAGAAVDSATGVVSWTPALGQQGDFAVTLRASADGYSAAQSYLISTAPGNTGDINEDGVLDASDILLGQRIVLGLLTPDAAQQVRGDLTADGAVQGADLLVLERRVMGW